MKAGDGTIRELTASDVQAALSLSSSSGWNQTAEDWLYFLERPTCRVYGRLIEGELAGTSAVVSHGDLAWIAMMLVRPEYRQRGVGTSLLKAALAEVCGRAVIGLDATPAGEPLYRATGFAGSSTVARMIANGGGAPQGQRLARRMGIGDFGSVAALDRRSFGADRSDLLKHLLIRAPELALVAYEGEAGGLPTGFAFGRRGRSHVHIGPIVARDINVAASLLTQAMDAVEGASVMIDAPTRDAFWVRSLEGAGFREERRFLRMYLGDQAPVTQPSSVFAIAGPEFG